MPSPSIDQDKELAEFFTDVEHLREAFKNAVAAPTLTKRLFVIHGVGGVGKSSLLRMFRLHCKSVNVPIALASGDEAKSAFDILARWTEDLKVDRVSFPAFSKTYQHYREIQVKVEVQAKKAGGRTADIASKAASKTAEAAGGALAGAAIGSVIPGIGTTIGGALGGVVGGMGAEALTDWLRGFLKQPDIDLLLDPAKKLTDDFLGDMKKASTKRRIVLMLDTFEQMTALDDWTRDVAQRLPVNVLFVIAGRALPNWGRAWDSWQKHAQVDELKPMTEDVMRELIQRYYATMRGGEPNLAQVEAIIRFAHGLPMVVTSAVQLWVKYGVEDFHSVKAEIVANLVDRLMEGVPNALIPALEAAAIVRWFDQPILRAVMKQDDVRDAYNELRRFPFVRVRVEGLALHDAVREIMDENLHMQDAERHGELHQRAAAYFQERLGKAAGEEAERFGLEQLYHLVRADEAAGIRLFQEMAEEFARYRLFNRLRVLLNDVNTYPLNQTNSVLWLKYYNVTLSYFEARVTDEGTYQSIGDSNEAEPLLRAYALRDLGAALGKFEHLGEPQGVQKAIRIVERSLAFGLLDSHLCQNYFTLANIALHQHEWIKHIEYLEKAQQFYEQQHDWYGLVSTFTELKKSFGPRGDWTAFFSIHERGSIALSHFPAEIPALKARFLSTWTRVWAFIGRFVESEEYSRESVVLSRQIQDAYPLLNGLRDLGWALGAQGKHAEADQCFQEGLEIAQRFGAPYLVHQARILGFWGVDLLRRGQVVRAKDCLDRSLQLHQSVTFFPGTLPEVFNWFGLFSEVTHQYNNALEYYQKHAEWKTYGLYYFICSALTGLVRVKHAQGDCAAIPPLLAEAEQLAQQYEYNDHLASLRLTQGHVTWEGNAPTWDNGFEAALHFYQHALIYALCYNRFLLDEVLSGRPQGTPLRPIIPCCLERGDDEGRQMLTALRDWWQTGVNDIGTPRPDTISPIPEGIPLLEAERLAREREPGDGSPQKSVIEQIEAALSFQHAVDGKSETR